MDRKKVLYSLYVRLRSSQRRSLNNVMPWTGDIRLLHHGMKKTKTPLLFSIRTKTRTTVRDMQKVQAGPLSASSYILLSIPMVTFGLGCWQVKRRKWKLNLIDELQEKTRAALVAFPTDLSQLPSLEYRRVRVSGQFDHSRELYVMPRSPVSEENTPGKLVGGQSQSGACVITPFRVSGADLTILVNRGWISKEKLDPRTRQQGQVTGEVDLVGVVRKSEKRSAFGTKNNPSRNQWFYKDSDQMASVLGTDPIMLDADADSTIAGGPLGGQTRVTLRNEHFSYIITWYTLCVATSYLWYRLHWVKK